VALLRLDREGRIRWVSRLRHHHDVRVAPDGTILGLVREVRAVRALRRRRVVDDSVVVLDPDDGRVLRATSLVEAVARSPFPALASAARDVPFDVLHANTVERLDGRAAARNPAFAEGSYLVTALAVDAVLVVDPELERVTWAQIGPWRRAHDAQVVADGRVLLFDNRPPGPSRLLALDPADGAVKWTWDGGSAPFASTCCGAVQPLGHGGHLVTVTDEGRAVEIDGDGRVVWAWRSPHRVGERVARLFDVTRAPPVEALPWLAVE
jgi:outer membrane protein assembly factor BamB